MNLSDLRTAAAARGAHAVPTDGRSMKLQRRVPGGHTRRRPADGTPTAEYTENVLGVSNEPPSREGAAEGHPPTPRGALYLAVESSAFGASDRALSEQVVRAAPAPVPLLHPCCSIHRTNLARGPRRAASVRYFGHRRAGRPPRRGPRACGRSIHRSSSAQNRPPAHIGRYIERSGALGHSDVLSRGATCPAVARRHEEAPARAPAAAHRARRGALFLQGGAATSWRRPSRARAPRPRPRRPVPPP